MRNVEQSMIYQYRQYYLLIMLACSGITMAHETNLTKARDTTNTLISEKIESNAKHNEVKPVILISSGDHVQDLERSLQEFDEKLLRELEQAQQERQESARQKAALRSDAELESESEGESESESEAESEASASGEGQDGSQEANEAEAASAQTGGGAAAPEENDNTTNSENQEKVGGSQGGGSAVTEKNTIPSGDDDDIIARQLREAAEAETDPVIKEKLWAEYRKYKNQQSSNTPL